MAQVGVLITAVCSAAGGRPEPGGLDWELPASGNWSGEVGPLECGEVDRLGYSGQCNTSIQLVSQQPGKDTFYW